MTYRSQASTLERDIEKTITLIFKRVHVCECQSWQDDAGEPRGLLLTRALASQQVLALRLIRIDGRDRDIVFGEGVQVFQDVGGLVAAQDGLVNGA